MARWHRVRTMTAVLVAGTAAAVFSAEACGGGREQTVWGPDGCMICDPYGCRSTSASACFGTVPTGADAAVMDTASGAETSTNDADAVADAQSSCDPKATTCPCGAGRSCDQGLSCIDGLCLKACSFSSECGTGRICVNGKCVVGCNDNPQCPTGYRCDLAKGVCAPDTSNPQCDDSHPCVGGLKCVSGICQGQCTSNGECASDEICDATSSTCMKDPQPKPPCAQNPTVCGTERTCDQGYCRYPCKDSSACLKIDNRIPECSGGVCRSATEANPQCTKKDDCSAGQDCVSNECK